MVKQAAGRVAIVTGASRGIGRAIAMTLAHDGFAVAVSDLESTAGDLQDCVLAIRDGGGSAIGVVADVTDPQAIEDLVAKTVDRLGRVDVAVANAGIARREDLLDVTAEGFDQMFAVNARGLFLTWQAAARQMIAQGGGGKLIGAASTAAHRASAVLPIYAASKFAVRGLTQAAAQSFAKHGITVNSYAPGIVDTPLWDPEPGFFAAAVAGIPLGRAQTVDDVAQLVSFLASPKADYMTGQTVIMDGGMVFS